MNSRTSPTSAQGGRVLPVATPISLVAPGWPSLRSPICLWGSSSLPLLPSPSLPLPFPGPGMDRLAGGWSGEEHGLGGRQRRGHFLEGYELQREPRGCGNSWKCGCRVWREQAEPEKTREVGWGKGKGGNWIRRAALLKGSNNVFYIIAFCPPLSFPSGRNGKRSQVLMKGGRSELLLLVRCWERRGDIRNTILF